MTAPARVPSKTVRDKAGRIVDDHDTGHRPILVDVKEPQVPAFSALVPAGSRVEPYVVSYGELLGWRCDCRASVRCAHVCACMVLAERAGFNKEDLT